MKVFLDIPYCEKDEAKQLGACWDAYNKKWYCFGENVLVKKWKMNTEPINLIGEDRHYGGSMLYIDTLPRSAWGENVRTCVEPVDWDRIKNHVYKRVDRICEICNVDTKISPVRIEAHERWEFNVQTNTQKLVRLVALCHWCHMVTHIGYAGGTDEYDATIEHFKKVRGFADEQECIESDTRRVRESLLGKWDLDLSILTLNGIQTKTK